MSSRRGKQIDKVLLTGFSDDVAAAVSKLGPVKAEIMLVTEDATGEMFLDSVDLVIYVLSSYSGFSSRLRGVWSYVHHLRQSLGCEYLLPLAEFKIVFPEIEDLPVISIDELKIKLSLGATL